MTGEPRVDLVRHGQTAWSASGRHTGRSDLELDQTGVEQATLVGSALAGQRYALVMSSPLVRARETCRLAGFGEQAVVTADLSEWDYGVNEGRTTAEIEAEHPGWSLWTDSIPQGESLEDVSRRADAVLERIAAADGDVLCFSHGHFLRVLAARWIGFEPRAGQVLSLDAGSLSQLGWEHHRRVLAHWNWHPQR
jgi:broad specificity phosphatase PhoE